MGALKLLPVVAVGGAVVEVAIVLDGAPVGGVGLEKDGLRFLDLGHGGRHRAGDGLDLRRVDGPLAEEAEFEAGAQSVLVDEVGVLEL